MARGGFEVRVQVVAPPAEVYAHLLEPRSQLGLQPLLTRIEGVEYDRDGSGRARARFEAIERLRFVGFVRYDNRIRVECVGLLRNRRIGFTAWSRPGIVVHSEFALEPRGDGSQTRVVESVEIEAPGILLAMTLRIARRAHERLVLSLRARMAVRPCEDERA